MFNLPAVQYFHLICIFYVMFSNRVCVSSTYSLVVSELQSAGSLSTDQIDVHGLSWTVVFYWTHGRIEYKVGVDQSPDCVVGVAARASVVFWSSSWRIRRAVLNGSCMLTCTDAKHSVWRRSCIFPSEMDRLLEDGALKMRIKLEVFKPIIFRNISLAATYHTTTPPSNCEAILGVDGDGSVYALRSLSTLDLGIEQWCVYCFRPFLPHRGIILALINMRSWRFKGSGFDRENKRIAVTQSSSNNSSLQLDILDWGSGRLETRTYDLEDQDVRWSAATPHKQGWLCVASGLRDHVAHYRFWSLGDDSLLKLEAEFATSAAVIPFALGAASLNGNYYCLKSTKQFRIYIWVGSWEQPNLWQPYELVPTPNFHVHDCKICYEWGHLILIGKLFSGPDFGYGPERQDAVFKLRFEVSDCLIEPYLVLPKEVHNWIIGNNGFLALDRAESLINFFGMEPPSLKIRALLAEGAEKST